MRSTRVLTILLVFLVLVPTAILGWMGVRGTDRFEAELRQRLTQDLGWYRNLASMSITFFRSEEVLDRDLRVAAAAELIAGRLPFESAGTTLQAAKKLMHTFRNERTRGEEFDRLWDPALVELRVLDAQGSTVLPASLGDETLLSLGGDAERLLADFGRAADTAAFGRDDLPGALAIWRSAAARFAEPVWKARSEIEALLLLTVHSRAPQPIDELLGDLEMRFGAPTLGRVGRPWVLLLLRGATESGSALTRLHALDESGALAEVPLTEEERRRVRQLLDGEPPSGEVRDRAGDEVHRVPLPGGLILEIRRFDAGRMGVIQERMRRDLPKAAIVELSGLPLVPPPVVGLNLVDTWQEPTHGKWYAWVTLRHRDAPRLLAEVESSRRWTIVGVLSLVGVIGIAGFLGRSILAREREARRLKDDFLANVSHELRTPLTSVCLHADLLSESGLSEPQRRAHAEVVRAEGARLSALVDDMLDFAALERGSRRLEPEPVDLAAAAERALAPLRVLADREGVEITLHRPPGEHIALADSHALGRILSNLVGNAWKHGRPSRDGTAGRLAVRVGSPKGRPTVDVVDDGPGIPVYERTCLFERFQRGAAAATTRGVGLGLALSRDLARALGGDLTLVEDPSRTVFRLTLPSVPLPPPDSSLGTVA